MNFKFSSNIFQFPYRFHKTDYATFLFVNDPYRVPFNVGVNEPTAALGTMIASTQQRGSEAARAFKTILLNIRQVLDGEEGIITEGLAKYEDA